MQLLAGPTGLDRWNPSYFHNSRADIIQALMENTGEPGDPHLRKRLGEAGYLRLTGQGK